MTVKEKYEEIKNILPLLEEIVGTSDYDKYELIDSLTYDETNPDDVQLILETAWMLERLNDVILNVTFLEKKIKTECILYLNENDKYAYKDPEYGEIELTEGSPIEFYFVDEDGNGVWVRSAIAYDDDEYYIEEFTDHDLNGTVIRVRES